MIYDVNLVEAFHDFFGKVPIYNFSMFLLLCSSRRSVAFNRVIKSFIITVYVCVCVCETLNKCLKV